MSAKSKKPVITEIPTEIQLLIVSFLGLNDLFCLIRTCKSLSPVARQQLYSKLHFGIGYDAFGRRGTGPREILGVGDDFDIRITPEKCTRFLETVGGEMDAAAAATVSSGSGGSGSGSGVFRLTRSLVIHQPVYVHGIRNYDLKIAGIFTAFGQMIENGEMPALKRVFLHTRDNFCRNLEGIRPALNKRNESEQNSPISMGIKLAIGWASRVFDTEDSFLNFRTDGRPWIISFLTHLDIQFRLRNVWEGIFADVQELGLATQVGNAKAELEHLVDVLSRAPGLKFLRLENFLKNTASGPQYDIFEMHLIGEDLGKLQQAILGLEKLETLVLSGVIFHHSWFVIPPKNVRTLDVKGPFTDVWYREFAKQPLVGVEDLTIAYCDDGCGIWESSEGWELDLGPVRVEGLKRFAFLGYDGPEDWVGGLVERNRGLEVVRGDVDVERMEAMGWRFYTRGEDEYWLKRDPSVFI
ncbi:hypothetical protein TWF718_004696 [Orbilia javanica]|uniref:F-box domain-containing protein n=1 Tax=Orbilia javanica TaxID=47235 RepID=A0AAN8RQL0_9PEZI